MLQKELKNTGYDNPEERASARQIVLDVYCSKHNTFSFLLKDKISDRTMIKIIQEILPTMKDPQDAMDLVKLRKELEDNELKSWINVHKIYYNMKEVISKKTKISYSRYKNYCSGRTKLTRSELEDIKWAMQDVGKDPQE